MAMTKLKLAGATLAILTVGGFLAIAPTIAQQPETQEAAPPSRPGGREGPPAWRREDRGRPWMRGPHMGPGTMNPEAAGRMCEERIARMAQFRLHRIEQAVKPTDAQRAAFEEFKSASQKAGEIARGACATEMALTPTGRLEMAERRTEARLQAIRTLRPALDAFYASLSDEQKARFNALGAHRAPQWAGQGQRWHHMWRGPGREDERGGWRGRGEQRESWRGRGDEREAWHGRGEGRPAWRGRREENDGWHDRGEQREGWHGRPERREGDERRGNDGRRGNRSDNAGEERL
jgi:LTXXQ motif family protein